MHCVNAAGKYFGELLRLRVDITAVASEAELKRWESFTSDA